MAWNDEYTPTADYPEYPVALLPEADDPATAEDFLTLMSDVYNRIEFLKEASDGNITHIANIETGTGLDKDSTTASTFSGTVLDGTLSLKAACEALDAHSTSLSTSITNINTNVGGEVSSGSKPTYSSTTYIANEDTHNVAIGKLDSQLSTTNTTASGAASTAATNSASVTNIANKVGDSATAAGTGFSYDSTNFISNNDKLKVAVEKLDKPLGAHRYVMDELYRWNVLNWRDTSFGEAGGATPDNYFFETLTGTSKFDSGESTGVHSAIEQTFGSSDGSWTYVSNIVAVPSGTNRVKMRFRTTGTVTISVNLAGSPTTGFVAVDSEDTYVTVPTGTQLVIRAQGGAGAYLHSYAALYKEV